VELVSTQAAYFFTGETIEDGTGSDKNYGTMGKVVEKSALVHCWAGIPGTSSDGRRTAVRLWAA